jgi:hypothetical protein
VKGHTAPSSPLDSDHSSLLSLSADLAAAIMAAWEPRKARPPCSRAALQHEQARAGELSRVLS